MSGSPYVGDCSTKTGSGASFSSSYKTFLRQFFEAQIQTWEKGSGWLMWTWKTEGNSDEWSYQAGIRYGWIPSNPTNYQYPNICG
jgi:glucan 1,3-beta-glucosidase